MLLYHEIQKTGKWRTYPRDVPRATDPKKYCQIDRVIVRKGLESISQSEEYIMYFQHLIPATGRELRVIGGKTQGANGNITRVELPGGFAININFDYITHPNGAPVQRVGV